MNIIQGVCSEIIFLELQPHLSGANELIKGATGHHDIQQTCVGQWGQLSQHTARMDNGWPLST